MPKKTSKTANQKRWELLQSQLALIHGVLEELCERQETLGSWHTEFARKMVYLHEKQWQTMEALAGHGLSHPNDRLSASAQGSTPIHADAQRSHASASLTPHQIEDTIQALTELMNEDSEFDSASEFVDQVDVKLKKTRNRRLKKQAKILQKLSDDNDMISAMSTVDNSDSILVLNDSQTLN